MIWQMIEDWFRGILTDGILSNLSGLFDSINTEVGEVAGELGTTPAAWNAGIFNMIRSLSENVIVPIAGVIITFVMCYELIQLVIEKNNLHDVDTWIFFKWIFKTFVAVLIVTNTWSIVMGVFDVTQSVVNDSAGVIISDTSIDISSVITDMEARLEEMSVGGLLGLWFQSLFVGLTMKILTICIMLVVYGRMIEIYLVTSVAPDPYGDYDKSRMGIRRAELFEVAACPWFSSLFDYGMCRDLCGAGAEHFRNRRHIRRDLVLHGIYRPIVFYAFQDGKSCKEHIQRALRRFDEEIQNHLRRSPLGICAKESTRRRGKALSDYEHRKYLCLTRTTDCR